MLNCKSRYSATCGSRRFVFAEGMTINEGSEVEAWLLADAPGCFEQMTAAAPAPPSVVAEETEETIIEDKAIPHRGPGRPARVK